MKNERRTLQQSRSLHLWFTQLARALNELGFDMRKTISEGIDLPWTAYTIKEYLFRPTMKTLYGKESTTKLLKIGEIDCIFDVINKAIGERTGIYIPFPSLESLMEKEDILKPRP